MYNVYVSKFIILVPFFSGIWMMITPGKNKKHQKVTYSIDLPMNLKGDSELDVFYKYDKSVFALFVPKYGKKMYINTKIDI